MDIARPTRFIGVDCVTVVIVRRTKRKLAVSLPCKDPDTKRKLNVNYVDLKHRTRYN